MLQLSPESQTKANIYPSAEAAILCQPWSSSWEFFHKLC